MVKVIANLYSLYHNSRMSRASDLHDDLFYPLGLWNLMKDELHIFPCCLNCDISELEKCLDHSVRMRGNVLYPMTVQFRDFSIEESMLVAVNNATVGDNDCIECVYCERVKDAKP